MKFVIGKRPAHRDKQRDGARPGLVDDALGLRRHVADIAFCVLGATQVHRKRASGTALELAQGLHSLSVGSHGRDSVDGLRREANQLARLKRRSPLPRCRGRLVEAQTDFYDLGFHVHAIIDGGKTNGKQSVVIGKMAPGCLAAVYVAETARPRHPSIDA